MTDKISRRKRKFYEILAEVCEVPADAVSKSPVFVLRGKHELEISGCTGIKEYTGERIVLKMKNDTFTVIGDNLELTDFLENVLYIRGNIISMGYGIKEVE